MNQAHGMRLQHAIFQGPLKPTIELEEIATPSNYTQYPGGDALPKKLKAWRVHSGDFGSDGKGVDVGLVASPDGWDSTPDAEWISGGVNSKGVNSTALGRDANLFFWGFYGDPTRLTESAKQVFVNTIVYMKQFDGHAPTVERSAPPREGVFGIVYWMKNPISKEESFTKYLRERVETPVLESTKGEPDAIEREYRARLEYVWSTRDHKYKIDPELEGLALSNRKLAFFDTLLAKLEANPKDPIADRLLARYAPDAPRSAAALRAWVEANRERLFFSDVGGYRWYVSPRPIPPAAATASKPANGAER